MSNVVIYYKMSHLQKTEEVIEEIKKNIEKIDKNILNVHIDHYNESENFNILTGYDLNSVDYLYINTNLEDDFEIQLINELARAFHFKIVYF